METMKNYIENYKKSIKSKRKKICNQHFVKDDFRNTDYAGTIKCACCDEESVFAVPFPFPLEDFILWITNFQKLHDSKGCNIKQLEPPDWVSIKLTFSIAK